jgi:hypothetical protein
VQREGAKADRSRLRRKIDQLAAIGRKSFRPEFETMS